MSDSDDYWDEDEFEKELYDPDDPVDTFKYHRGANVFVVIEGSFDDPNSVVVKGDVIKDMDKNVEVYLRGNYNKVMKVEQRFIFDNEDNAEDYAEERDMEGYDRPKPKKPKPPPKTVADTGLTTAQIRAKVKAKKQESIQNRPKPTPPPPRPKTPSVDPLGMTDEEKAMNEATLAKMAGWYNPRSKKYRGMKGKTKTEAIKAVAKTPNLFKEPKPATKAEILKKKFQDDMDEFEAFLDEDTPTQATILPPLSDSTKKKAMPTFTPEQLLARERRRKFSLPSI